MTGFWRKGFTAAAMGVGLLAFAGSALAQSASEPATNNPAATSPAPTAPAPAAPAANEPTTPAPTNPAPAPAAQEPTPTAPATPAPAAQQPASEAPAANPAPATEPAAAQQPAPEAAQPIAPAAEAPAFVLPHDLSPWGMFMAADWVVKSVMIGLALASLATWTVWVAKSLELAGARNRAKRALKIIGHSATLSDAVRSLERRERTCCNPRACGGGRSAPLRSCSGRRT